MGLNLPNPPPPDWGPSSSIGSPIPTMRPVFTSRAASTTSAFRDVVQRAHSSSAPTDPSWSTSYSVRGLWRWWAYSFGSSLARQCLITWTHSRCPRQTADDLVTRCCSKVLLDGPTGSSGSFLPRIADSADGDPQSRGFRSSSMFVALLGKFIWVFAGVSEPVR